MVSALRPYRDEEVAAMLPVPARGDWAWEFGSVRALGLWKTPYFFGYRRMLPTASAREGFVEDHRTGLPDERANPRRPSWAGENRAQYAEGLS